MISDGGFGTTADVGAVLVVVTAGVEAAVVEAAVVVAAVVAAAVVGAKEKAPAAAGLLAARKREAGQRQH